MKEAKQGKNLRLTPNLVEKAEKICAENDTTLGRVVDKLLLELIKFEKAHGELRKFKIVSKIEFERFMPPEKIELNAELSGASYTKVPKAKQHAVETASPSKKSGKQAS